MAAGAKQYVIIVGCGRLGAFLANKLSGDGHSVVAIDVKETAFNALAAEYSGFRVEGDATEFAVLQAAKANKADLLIATTLEDNVNLMVAQVAKQVFGIKRVIARAFDPAREDLYRKLGVEPVCPTRLAGQAILRSLAEPEDGGEEARQP